eukprot:Gb_19328 [translate_table: standard]
MLLTSKERTDVGQVSVNMASPAPCMLCTTFPSASNKTIFLLGRNTKIHPLPLTTTCTHVWLLTSGHSCSPYSHLGNICNTDHLYFVASSSSSPSLSFHRHRLPGGGIKSQCNEIPYFEVIRRRELNPCPGSRIANVEKVWGFILRTTEQALTGSHNIDGI